MWHTAGMRFPRSANRWTIVIVACALIATGCRATETVTITDPSFTETGQASASTERESSPQVEPTAEVGLSIPAETDTDDRVEPATTEDPGQPDSGETTAGSGERSAPLAGEGCQAARVDFVGDIQIEMAFTSPTSELSDVEVSYLLTDPADATVTTGRATLYAVMPGESLHYEIDTLTELPAGVSSVSDLDCNFVLEATGRLSGSLPGPGDGCRFVEIDEFDDIQIELTATATDAADDALYFINFALRDSSGARFDTGVATFSPVNAGEPETIPHDTLTELPPWAEGDTVSCDLLSIES
jgi:hypothetical protein